ncbi:hypothetical protein [Nocardia crassostreae]|uniref:hypothetical protein n=1 Tax=Nocardia crassostreae TaxID=53428 RepID=UPI0012F81DC1|nr:hypothetical protein [Nocardia crassostreae]
MPENLLHTPGVRRHGRSGPPLTVAADRPGMQQDAVDGLHPVARLRPGRRRDPISGRPGAAVPPQSPWRFADQP